MKANATVTPLPRAAYPLWFVSDDQGKNDSRDLIVGASTLEDAITFWRDRWLTADEPQNVFRINGSSPVCGSLGWHGPNCRHVHESAAQRMGL